jgi:hypothetical protein
VEHVKYCNFGTIRQRTVVSATGSTAEMTIFHVAADVLNSELIRELIEVEVFFLKASLISLGQLWEKCLELFL